MLPLHCHRTLTAGFPQPLRRIGTTWLGAALVVPMFAALSAPAVQAQIYRCQNPDGVVEYSNAVPDARRAPNCKKVDLPAITTIPATPLPSPRAPAADPGNAAAAAAFPRVDSRVQRNRDDERRGILQAELKSERARLEQLEAEYNGGEPERLGNERNYQKYLDRVESLKAEIARRQGNIGALEREMAQLGN